MAEQVGVRDLKARLSYYLRRVSEGDVLIVTDRGKPVAEIHPTSEEPEARLAAMVSSGKVMWNGSRLSATRPLSATYPGKSVADLVLRDRE